MFQSTKGLKCWISDWLMVTCMVELRFDIYTLFSRHSHLSLSLFSPTAEPLSLMDLCRRSVRVALGRDRLSEIHRLPLPVSLKNYLLYQWWRWLTVTTQTRHTLFSFSCFSGIILGLNPSDNIAQASRTDSAFHKYASVSVAGLWVSYPVFMTLCNCTLSNFIKSGITEHYAHADPDDALTVTMSVYLLLWFVVAYVVGISAVTSRHLFFKKSCSLFKFECYAKRKLCAEVHCHYLPTRWQLTHVNPYILSNWELYHVVLFRNKGF